MRVTLMATPPPARRARWLVAGFTAVLVIVAVFLGPRLSTRAQTAASCTPEVVDALGAGSVLTCTLTTTGAGSAGAGSIPGTPSVAPGGTLVISLTNPAAAAFVPPYITGSAITSAANPAGCALAPIPPPPAVVTTLTIDCAVASLGIPFDTPLTETIQLTAAPATPFVTETVTYNANGATSGSAPQSETSGSCTGGPPTFTCMNTPGAATGPGGTLALSVTGAPGEVVQITPPAPVAGTCPLATSLPTAPSAPGGSVTVTFLCGPGQNTGFPPTPVSLTAAVISGTGTPTENTTANASSLVTSGGCDPLDAYIPPAPATIGTCSNMPAAAAVSGGSLTLSVAAAPGQTIAIINPITPGSGNTCALTTSLPTSVSNPGGVVQVSFVCGPGETTGTGTFSVTAVNQNGVPGTPSELTTVSTVNVTTGVPAPTVTTVTFAIGPATATPVTGQTPTGMTLIADPEVTVPNQGVTFTAAAMTPNFVGTATANIAQFRFAFGDGAFQLATAQFTGAAESATALHTYPAPGVYIAVVQAVDSTGLASTASTTVTVKADVSYLPLYQPLPPSQLSAGTSMKVNLTIASQQIAGTSDQVAFTWTAVTQVNPAQSFSYSLPPSNGGQTPQSVTINWGDGSPVQPVPLTPANRTLNHTYTQPGQFVAILTATDTLGNAGTGSAIIDLPSLPSAAGGTVTPTPVAAATPSPSPSPVPAPVPSPVAAASPIATTTGGTAGGGAAQATAYFDPSTSGYYVVLAFCAYDSSGNPAPNTNETLDFSAADGSDLGATMVSTGSEGCFSGNVQPDGSGKTTAPTTIVTSDGNGGSYTFPIMAGSPSTRPVVGPIH